MKIFLSYSSEQEPLAEEICLELEHSGHSVFFDKKSLRASNNFRKRIRNELDRSDVFVFLISPASVAPKSYARSELEIAREKWPQPAAHILPVMAAATDLESVPPYLKAVTILSPEGEIVEAVSRSLDNWSPMEEVDRVDYVRKIAEASIGNRALVEFVASAAAIASFQEDVLERGTPTKYYRRRIRQLVGDPARLVYVEHTAKAGGEYKDDRGRICRDLTVSSCIDGKWSSTDSVWYRHHGQWVPLPPGTIPGREN